MRLLKVLSNSYENTDSSSDISVWLFCDNPNWNIPGEPKGWTKKTSLKFYFVNLSATYESRRKVLHILALLMQISKMTLTQFLGNFWAKIFKKPWGGSKIKVSLFMEVFEGSNHPFWVGPALPGWWKTFFCW